MSETGKKKREFDDAIDEMVATKGWDSSLVKRLAGEARPHARMFAVTFVILGLLFLLELASPWILRSAIDGPVRAAVAERSAPAEGTADGAIGVDVPGTVGESAQIGESMEEHRRTLLLWAAAFLACTLLTMVFRFFEIAHLNRTGQMVIADLRTKVFAHLQRLDLAYFDRRPTGSLVTRVTTDIENLNEMFTSGLVIFLVDLIKIAALLALLFVIHAKLALVVMLLMPLLIGISLVFRGGARSAHRTVRARLARLNGYLQEVLSGIRVVKVFRREKRVSKRFEGYLDRYLSANMRTIFLFALFFPSLDFVVTGVQGATMWVGGIDIAGGQLTYGVFFQFWIYVAMLLQPVRELGERYNVLQSAFASAERIFDVLDTKPTVVAPAPGRPLHSAGHIRFENVSFSYVDGVEVLEDVSFDIPPGSMVAVVGATGAGKSTLVNLLLRFYDPSAGRITIDGVDLREIDLTALRRNIGIVLQEDFLFAGTIRDNLVMDREQVSDASLQRALVASRAETVIEALPGKLEAPVAERGATLSTGERQLLAIARALAGEPRVIVLDEATASVDSNIEAQIEQAQANLLEGRSSLVVAHRLSTIRRADRILVMHRGELRESGTHDELLAEGGIYARLHALQFA